MKIKQEFTDLSPLRSALGLLWTLNFKAMPSALLWAVALFVSIQTKSLLIRLLAISLCSVAAIFGAHLIKRNLTPRMKMSYGSAFTDKVGGLALGVSGVAFAITLENVSRYAEASRLIRLLMVSNFLTVLLVWLFVQVVVIPLRFTTASGLTTRDTFSLALNYIAKKRKPFAISMLSLLLGWPLFFFYFLLVLTFAQAMTFSSTQIQEGASIGK